MANTTILSDVKVLNLVSFVSIADMILNVRIQNRIQIQIYCRSLYFDNKAIYITQNKMGTLKSGIQRKT